MLFDHGGGVVSIHQLEHEQIYPKPGWVEHNPMEIWARTQDVVKGALQKVGATVADIAAVGVTNQRETTIVWNKNTGVPYYNAIVWQDTRTDKICNDLAANGGQDRFRGKVGLPLATYFSGPKVKWILDNVDGARAAAERGEAIFGNIDTFEIWWLTGGPNGGAHVTDVSNASRTMLMNLSTLDWDAEILSIMGIPRQMLPRIVSSSDPDIYGYTPADGPFGGRIPVCGDLGDQQAALVGQTCFGVGEAKNTYGTGCFMLLNTGTKAVPSNSGLLTTLANQQSTLWRDRSPSPARSSSGCGTIWAFSRSPAKSRTLLRRLRTAAGFTSSRLSPACLRLTGGRMPVVQLWG
jgi:glycerol kinase